jgi:hypothetical protein
MPDVFDSIVKGLAGVVPILSQVAPSIASLVGGPLAGTGVTILERVFGLEPNSGPEAISQALLTATPEQLAQLKQADNEFAVKMKEADIEVLRLNAADVASAREMRTGALRTGNRTADLMAWLIMISFLGTMGGVLAGCYLALQGGLVVTPENTPIWLAVTGLIGSIVGYFASNAQSVIGFLYGSTQGSQGKTDQLGQAVNNAMDALAKSRPAK